MNNLYQWFHFKNEPMFSASENIDMQFYHHLHMQFEFIYVLDGEINVSIDNQARTLKKNDICIIPSNIIHSYTTVEPNKIFMMIFDPKLFPEFNKYFRKKKLVNYFISARNKEDIYINCFKNILDIYSSNNKVLLYGYAYIIFGETVEQLELVDDSNYESSSLQKVLDYVKNNYENDISLETTAKEIGISKFYISKLINNKVGCSFNYYLNIVRINKAIKLLEEDKAIIEASYESGFNSPRTFYRVFKEVLNTTPMKYKKTQYQK